MNKLTFATSNDWKFSLAKKYFQKKDIQITQRKIDLPESRSEDVIEIAREKALYAFKKINSPLFVLDAAFYIKALDDFPKTYVKFAEKYLGARGILKLLKGVNNRKWEFHNIIYYKDNRLEKPFSGIVKGHFADKIDSEQQIRIRKFEAIQKPKGYNKTFGQMNDKEMANFYEKTWMPAVFDEFIKWLKNY